MFTKYAIVLNAFDTCCAGAGNRLLMDYFVLEPQVGNAETNHVIHNSRNMFGGAKHIDKIDACARSVLRSGLRSFEVWITFHLQNFIESRVHRNYSITIAGKIAPDVMARAPSLIAHAYHGNRSRRAQHLVNDSGIVHAYLLATESRVH